MTIEFNKNETSGAIYEILYGRRLLCNFLKGMLY